MNQENARAWVRSAVQAQKDFLDYCTNVEFEIIGGFLDLTSEKQVAALEEAAKPENIAAFKESVKGKIYAIDEILEGAACGATDEEIASDEWIDRIIAEIQENCAGCAFMNENDDVEFYEPPGKDHQDE